MRTTSKLFLTVLAALGLVACSNEETPQIDGERATVTVKIFTDVPTSSRAVGNVDAGNASGVVSEREVHSLEVWLFAGNLMVGHAYFDELIDEPTQGLPPETQQFYRTDAGYVAEGITTTSGARTMVAVANHPEIGASTRTGLLNRVSTIELTQEIKENGLVMTSEEVPLVLTSGENLYGKPEGTHHENNRTANIISPDENLLLTRINARIALVGLNFQNTTDDDRYNGFELTEVALFNARRTSNIFGADFARATSLVAGNTFLFGNHYPSTQSSYVGYTGWANTSQANRDNGYYSDPYRSGDGSLTASLRDAGIALNDISRTNAYYYYAYENDDVDGTYIVLKGKLLLDGAPATDLPTGLFTDGDGYTYYAIWINATAGDNIIKRNTQYNLTVNLWGAGNPTIDPSDEAYLDVHVEVVPWFVVEEIIDWGTPTP
jgi:hypothetical protein